MASTTILPLSFLLHPPQSHHHHHAVPSGRLRNPSFTNLRASSSSTSETSPSPSPAEAKEDVFQLSRCKACGREEIERGCNGEGRIQGGIATVPGFGWWPIKAYRPCPGFVESGGRYRRRGQSMDEVAFGRGDRERSVDATTLVFNFAGGVIEASSNWENEVWVVLSMELTTTPK